MDEMTTKIKVVGVGGCGTNAVISMIRAGLRGVEYFMVNTDKAHLDNAYNTQLTQQQRTELSDCLHTVKIGEKTTKGQGAGADPTIGELAAEESKKDLNAMLGDTDLLFLVAGMGGGTGTGASPTIAKIAREINPDVLIVSAVTKPLRIEFNKKMVIAEKGIEKLQKIVDSLIIIPNQSMVEGDTSITLTSAYEKVNSIISTAVMSITDLINETSQINVDFADIKKTMKGRGYSHIGLGKCEGTSTSDRMIKAVKMAASTDILNTNISGASGLIIHIQSSEDITYSELESAYTFIDELVSKDVETIFGHRVDPNMSQEVKVTLIAAGCKTENSPVNKRGGFYGNMPPQQSVQQMGGFRNRGNGYAQQQQSRPISQTLPQQQRQVPPQQPMQQPVQPTRIDSTQGGGVSNETPSFMKRLLGRKKDNR